MGRLDEEEASVHNVWGTFDDNDVVWNVLRMKENQGSVIITKDGRGYHWCPLRPIIR